MKIREEKGGPNKTVIPRTNYEANPVSINKKEDNNVTNSQASTPIKEKQNSNIKVKMRM